MTDAPRPRGFAALSPERRAEISRKGGSSVPPEKRYFAMDNQAAVEAGKKSRRPKGEK
jgi:uncharacterized protein